MALTFEQAVPLVILAADAGAAKSPPAITTVESNVAANLRDSVILRRVCGNGSDADLKSRVKALFPA